MGGLCAAIGFLKHSHLNVQVYEAAHHFSEIGAGVAFGPNRRGVPSTSHPQWVEGLREHLIRMEDGDGRTGRKFACIGQK